MNKTFKTSVIAIGIAGAGAIGVGSLAGASYGDEPPTLDDTEQLVDDAQPVGLVDGTTDGAEPADGEDCNRGRRGFRNGEAVAEALGLTIDELRDARDAGMSLADVAAQQGISADVVVDAIVDSVEAHLAEEVAEGDLTQEEADERLASAEERATEKVNAEPGERDAQGIRGQRGNAPAPADG